MTRIRAAGGLGVDLRGMDGGRFATAEADAITFTTHLVARSENLRRFAAHPGLTLHDAAGGGARRLQSSVVFGTEARVIAHVEVRRAGGLRLAGAIGSVGRR